MNTKILTVFMGLALTAVSGQTAEPTIKYEVTGNELIVTYTGTLYQSTDAVNWTEVASASSPYKVKIEDKKLFFCSLGGGEVQPVVPGENFSTLLPGGGSLDMIWIEPGTFIMGSPESELGRWNDEIQHRVTLTQGYWMGKFEVTQAQYEAIMGTNPSRFKGADLPVEKVSWDDAKEFCDKLTAIEHEAGRLTEEYEYTLPTEAQWEYACRAGTTTSLNSGKDLSDVKECPEMDEVGWYEYNSGYTTYPVGQKQPNACGLYDMHGNVNEWCLDWYKKDYYSISPVADPMGPEHNTGMYYRVMRGGSCYYTADCCRSATRNYYAPSSSDNDTGFRVALVLSSKNIIVPPTPGENATVSLSDTVNLDLNWIEPGTFTMGSPEGELGRGGDEDQHQVTLTQGYWMGKYEITQAQYEAIMGENPSRFIGADLPVEQVNWEDAMEFCTKLTEIEQAAGRLPFGYEYKLPTEAQWEYACRAGTTTAFNNGTDIETDDQIYGECPNLDPVGWYYSNSESKTHPVGLKQPNAWGLYDMHGNVMEWCQDAKVRYPETPVVDPVQEDIEPYYAVRGGSYSYYDDGAKNCRSAARNDRLNTATYLSLGFRVALAPVPSKDMTIPLTDKVNLDMIWIEPGTFLMGSPKDELGRYDKETQHEVTLTQGYWLGKYEVTQAQYETVMGTNPSRWEGADLPVEMVSWFDATNFCAKLTAIEKAAGRLPEGYEYTLPTEAQWEYACRAGTTTALNNGKNLSDREECPEMGEVGWYYYNNEIDGKQTTHPVGQKQPNDWGLYDMHGNVWEWCLDRYGAYPTSAVTDPTGPDTGSDRVMRGGSWVYVAYFCRSACRNSGEPNLAKSSIGFRVALAPVPSKDMTIPLAEDVDLDMIWIEPGTFIMGSPSDELGRYDDEVQHEVTLTQGYWLGKYEVTQAQYEAVMGTNPSGFKGADLPVEKVSWYDAKEFCAKLTAFEKATGRLPEGYEYTLPTEAQWEYACRAGTTTALNSGKNLSDKDQCLEMDEVGWYKYNSDRATHPVGQKLPNVWGLYDMHGNVWEWCLDRYGDYPTSAVTDPTGPIMGSSRVIRGGSWYFYAGGCRSATRSGNGPSYYDSNYGFRVALAPVK